ncbi:MAG: hypothetical protein JOZ84_00170, partial [Methylobacteriaceae bacterium]|nr:hypothetical protein [Methylobacteriaceae bacterium]
MSSTAVGWASTASATNANAFGGGGNGTTTFGARATAANAT